MLNSILLSLGLAALLSAIALLLLLRNERAAQRARLLAERQRALGLPEGTLVYEDADGQGEPLVSSSYPLVGKPDYVVELPDGRPVPIEIKPQVYNATAPYSNHVVQIGAYCLILEDYFAVPPTHGILRYADTEFTIEYTPALRRKVIRLLEEMQRCSADQPPALARQKAAKCRACPFQTICPIGRHW
ncbi:CRISPR-associated protein Cas4 [Thermogemmatispora sp.]|uniref:CRISPR-associated protein Cas4 n=1 Tax=Thermogemmatispora sp. TaxID=1968838 RepID=UPI001D8BBCE9|nr:CRISPR-associated protein Cas4 [Thermogemmatispora sp.]MBX5452239.1 CRISPR-associated protein Cas4 [Thermogemmatispora sp.]